MTRRISWLAVRGPGVSRMCTWTGPTKQIVITGLNAQFVDECPMSFDLQPGAEAHEVAQGQNGDALAATLGGYLFTVFDDK